MNDISYDEWLAELVGVDKDPNKYMLATHLSQIPYRYHFVLDENRAKAGENLRQEYKDIFGRSDEDVPSIPCSVMEMLVACARRFSENGNDISVEEAFAEICNNLELTPSDSFETVRTKVNKWLDGDQDVHAFPGPFPVFHYNGDARNLDIWNLMKIYISENYPLQGDWLV